MTTIRISEPDLLPVLLADIQLRADIVANVIAENAIRVSILGSYNAESLRMATFLRIRRWEEAQRARGVDVRVDLE
jgi:hypothetical protein